MSVLLRPTLVKDETKMYLYDARMVGQPEVVVGAEVQDRGLATLTHRKLGYPGTRFISQKVYILYVQEVSDRFI